MTRRRRRHPWRLVVAAPFFAAAYCVSLAFYPVVAMNKYRKEKREAKDKEERIARLRQSTMAEQSRRPYPRVAGIELETKRTVTIETRQSSENLSRCHPQQQSLLFTLPAELRNLIFEYATLPWLDLNHIYRKTEFYYRPGHEGRYITSTALLITCRRAWLEANHLPMQNIQHCFWFRGPGRRPKYLDDLFVDEANRLTHFVQKMTINNRNNLQELHLFAQDVWLQQHLSYRLNVILGTSSQTVCPEVLTVTVRHTDWPYWARDHALELREDEWLKELLAWPASPRLREVRIQLETLESRMDDLRSIVARVNQRYGRIERFDQTGSGTCRVELQQPYAEWTWSGPANIGNETVFADSERFNYRVVTLVWKVKPVEVRHAVVDSRTDVGDEFVNLTHISRLHVPGFTIQHLNESKPVLTSSGTLDPRDKAAQQWIQRWAKENSLLKFAPRFA